MSQEFRSLEVIQVAEPCPIPWGSMRGDEQVRFCAHCGRYVQNLSAVTSDEAQKLICEQAGRLCVRFERDRRGRVLTLDYQPVNMAILDIGWSCDRTGRGRIAGSVCKSTAAQRGRRNDRAAARGRNADVTISN